ncbi:MAG: alpha/beta hydrolase [Nannocystaceae bacterium]
MFELRPGQRIQSRIARALLGLPPALVARLAGRPIERDGNTLDPQVQLMLALQRRAGRPPLHRGSPEKARIEMEVSCLLLAPSSRPLAAVRPWSIAGPAGPIPARIYVPRGALSPAPALVYYHGGGFCLGSLDSHDPVCRRLADESGVVVASIDYRLAPEHPFPAAIDDALAAYRGVVAAADELGLDPARIAVGGDSAGGNLAAGVAIEARDDPRPPAAQILIYPGVDMTRSAASMRSVGEGFVLEKASIDWFVAHYLGDHDQRDPRASPRYAEVAGVAPALVVTAGFDPLRDEGDAYARKLADAGVAVEHHRHPSLFHGFLNASGGLRAGEAAMSEISASLRRLLAID